MIGNNIKRKRLELKMSQQELAEALGYKTRSSIAKIENGNSDISQSKLSSLANALNTTIDFLLNGVEKSNRNNPLIIDNITTCTDSDLNTLKEKSKTAAIILAGGNSARNQQNSPNQFITVNGKPVIIYTLEAYQRHPSIDEIYIVCLSGWENIIPAYARQYKITKLAGIIPAGKTGILSVKASIEWLTRKYRENDIVILQEATRPMISEEMISNIIRYTTNNSSAVTYELMDDYVPFLANTNGIEIIDRNKLLSIQSPEAYHFKILQQAFIQADKIHHKYEETCCAMFMYNMGKELVFCKGNRFNIKIIRQEDVEFFKALLSLNNKS